MPICTSQRAAYDRPLFWRVRGFNAARVGPWKYLKDESGEYLFDLANDPGEKSDLRLANTDRFDAIRRRYRDWTSGILPLPDDSTR